MNYLMEASEGIVIIFGLIVSFFEFTWTVLTSGSYITMFIEMLKVVLPVGIMGLLLMFAIVWILSRPGTWVAYANRADTTWRDVFTFRLLRAY